MYNYYQQQPTSSVRPPFPLKGHPVSSLEEAKASSIDFDGSVFYFPDIANKRIYTKQINLDGTAALNMYELKPIPSEPTPTEFVTRSEFDQALARISELLAQQNQKNEQKIATQPKDYKEAF